MEGDISSVMTLKWVMYMHRIEMVLTLLEIKRKNGFQDVGIRLIFILKKDIKGSLCGQA